MADLPYLSKHSTDCVMRSTTQSSRIYGEQSLPLPSTPSRTPVSANIKLLSPNSSNNFPFQEPLALGKSIMCNDNITTNTTSSPSTQFGAPPTAAALAFDPLMGCSKNDRHKLKRSSPNLPFLSNHVSSCNTDSAEILTDIAAPPSISLPPQDAESRMEDHMTTLGVKPKDSKKTHRHRRISSLDTLILGAKSKSFRDLGKSKKKSPTHSRTSTPLEFGNLTKDLLGLNLPFESLPNKSASIPVSNRRPIMHHRGGSQPSFGFSFLTQDISSRLRTSEREPAFHQIELPTSEEVLIQARLCALLEDYRKIDQNFDFSNLIGMTRLGMEGFVQTGVTPLDKDFNLVDRHVPIIKNLMECMGNGDLVLEDFFYSGNMDGAVDDRVEVAILRSESQRKLMTVWRGTTISQEKPVNKKERKAVQAAGTKGLETLHPDHLTPILPSFRKAYFKDELETKVFDSLNRLTEEFPFFDLVCTGFSFGATLATISASRYATSFPMMRVSSFAFGSPKIGGTEWRNHVHSLPNLKVIRLLNGCDTGTDSPSESVLTHVGHTILLTHSSGSSLYSGGGKSYSSPASPRSRVRKNVDSIKALAYKFDKNSHSQPLKSRIFKLKKPGLKSEKRDHSIHAYVFSMKYFTDLGTPWVSEYSGEDVGKGVKGMKDEKRNMV